MLLKLALKGSLGLTTAVLNAFFDVYSEEEYNGVLKELGVMKMLEENVENYKALVSVESRLDGKWERKCGEGGV